MTDFTSGYTTLLKKQWRALVYDYDAMLEGIGDGSKLYCLTNFQAMWLQQNVDYFRWKTRWNNLSVDSNELGVQADALELALMTCIDIQPYMLAFNYNQIVIQVLSEYDALYDAGGIPDLNPNTPTDFYSGDDSDERLNALCTACNIYVRSYASNWLTTAQAVLGVTIVIGIALSISIVGGIIAGTVLAGLALITQVAMDAMQDEDALDNVVCCMYNALNEAVVNQANFEASLDACGFGGGTNEAIIRDLIASDLDQFNNWLSFLNSLGDSYVLAQVGVFSCPCFDIWTSFLDFTTDDLMTLSAGQWEDGVGYKTTFTGGDRKIVASIDFTLSTVISIAWDADVNISVAMSGAVQVANVRYREGGVIQSSTDTIWNYFDVGLGLFDLSNLKDSFSVDADSATFFIRSSHTNNSGEAFVRSMTLRGMGIKPPELP